jgi:Leucine-rich repeat (LRR) protein
MIVRSVCLINDKQNHSNNIKDFSRIDLSTIDRLRLPDYASSSSTKDIEWKFGSASTIKIRKFIYLDIVSMNVNAFNDLPNLQSLHLRFGKPIKEIDLKHVSSLTELCLENQIVFAFYQEYLKTKLPSHLEKLSIIGMRLQLNSLKTLENLKHLELCELEDLVIGDSSHFNYFKHLTHLKIDACSFSIKKSFGTDKRTIRFDLANLEELVLSEVRHFEGKFYFGDLPKLKTLHATNTFEQIDLASLRRSLFLNLRDLAMRRNEDTGRMIHKYNDDDSFWALDELKEFLNHLPKLNKLNLDGVDRIVKDLFANLVDLEHLNLENCGLEAIHNESFANLSKLTYLSLSCNGLREIDGVTFKALINLETLDLSGNRELRKLAPGLFEHLNKLKILKMECCALKNIDPFAFKDLGNLEELKLSRNKLKDVAVETFVHLKQLKHLFISKNIF